MMKIQKHPDYLIFAQDSKSGELLDFPDVPRGWGITIDQTASKPPMEWMNGAFNRIDKNMLYILQQGVPEWSEQVFYPVNAIIKYNGIIYIAKVENESANPISNVNKWTKLIPDASTEHKGIVQLSSAIDSDSESQAATAGAVKKAYNLANTANKTANTANTTANTAKTNAATAQTKADSAYTLASTANTIANTAKSTAETDATTSAKGRVQLNSAVNSTAENQAATPKAVKDVYDFAKNALNNFIGVEQTWRDMKASRDLGITYTNTTGKPIQLIIHVYNKAKIGVVSLELNINNINIIADAGKNFGYDYGSASISIIIPSGCTYSAASSNNSLIANWFELR